ncbi:hypothetical protein DFH08DRAFT_827622 [Mycena albidolilacea]|uniref:Uncharacterized protein n=1 Tax=Mycena albidolilacea TaxID=1033008 RepID=A0AAD6YXU8_9AGAR|nr:hypothetical protein DFH08DRAFT_827622 [Mycena albidolilacea]
MTLVRTHGPSFLDDSPAENLAGEVDGILHPTTSRRPTPSLLAPMMEAWFTEFPEHKKLRLSLPTDQDATPLTEVELASLGAAIKTQRSKLENWFRNERKKIGKAGGNAAFSAATNAKVQQIFQQSIAKRVRAHQPVEIFQKRNGDLIKTTLQMAGYDLLKADSDTEEDNNIGESGSAEAVRGKHKKAKCMWLPLGGSVGKAVEAEVEEEKRQMAEEVLQAETRSLEGKTLLEQQQADTNAADVGLDPRPVERIVIPLPIPEPEKPKVKKSSKTKSKKTATLPVNKGPLLLPIAEPDETETLGSNESVPRLEEEDNFTQEDAWTADFSQEDYAMNSETRDDRLGSDDNNADDDDEHPASDDNKADDDDEHPTSDGPATPWPAGMTAPLTPAEAAAIAAAERGGAPKPASRPPVKPPAKKKSVPAPKKAAQTAAPAKQPAAKKATAVSAKKVAVAANSVVKRGRGRLPKLNGPLTDIANTVAAPDTSTSVPPPVPPAHVLSSTNNNCRWALEDAEADQAAKEQEVAAAKAKQVAKGWIEKMVDGGTVVTLLSARVRKLAKLADGSVVRRAPDAKLDASEVALLAHQKNARKAAPMTTKRKAAATQTSAAPLKRGLDFEVLDLTIKCPPPWLTDTYLNVQAWRGRAAGTRCAGAGWAAGRQQRGGRSWRARGGGGTWRDAGRRQDADCEQAGGKRGASSGQAAAGGGVGVGAVDGQGWEGRAVCAGAGGGVQAGRRRQAAGGRRQAAGGGHVAEKEKP